MLILKEREKKQMNETLLIALSLFGIAVIIILAVVVWIMNAKI